MSDIYMRFDLETGEKIRCTECDQMVEAETVYIIASPDSKFNNWYTPDEIKCGKCHDAH